MAMVLNDFQADSTIIDVELSNDASEDSLGSRGFYLKEKMIWKLFPCNIIDDDVFIQPDRTLESTAVFGQATIKLRDDLYISLGARYTEDEVRCGWKKLRMYGLEFLLSFNRNENS